MELLGHLPLMLGEDRSDRDQASYEDRDDRDKYGDLAWVERTSWYYFGLSVVLPMLGVVVLVTMGNQQSRFLLGVLSVSSMIGCAVLFVFVRRFQRDLAILGELAQLGHEQQATAY